MKTAVSMPNPLFEAAERVAQRLGLSRSQLYARALARYLEEIRREGVTERLNRIYDVEPSEPDPVLAALQARTLPRESW